MKQNGERPPAAKGRDRIIVIGLDSADPDLFHMWAKAGRLPFMSSLMESGVSARLLSTRGLFGDSPWPTFNAGVSPAKHGFYHFLQLKRGTTELIRLNARDCRYPPFWWFLKDAGKQVAIFDVPKTYPLDGLDGVQVAAWGEHYPLLNQSSLPSALVEDLSARFGTYRHPKEIVNPKRMSQELRIYDTLMSDLEMKLEATQFLMAQQEWDLFISVFAEAHYAGHQFFHHTEPRHWAHDRKWATRLGDTIPNIYAALDSALASLLQGVLEKTTVFIVSVHGIKTNFTGNFLVPEILERLGYQVPAGHTEDEKSLWSVMDLSRGLREMLPRSIKEFINERIVPQSFHDQAHSHQFSSSIDWDRTKAFFLPSDHFQGYISINLKGREPRGIIHPGAEYEETCNQLCQQLQRLVNPETGKPAVKAAVHISKIYHGKNFHLLPDVVIQWAEDGPINRLYHPEFGVISGQYEELRKSEHSADGFMIAAGKHIKKAAAVTGTSTMDLAPTILYLMGQPVPNDLDGRVLLELIDEDFKKGHEVQYEDRPLLAPEAMRL